MIDLNHFFHDTSQYYDFSNIVSLLAVMGYTYEALAKSAANLYGINRSTLLPGRLQVGELQLMWNILLRNASNPLKIFVWMLIACRIAWIWQFDSATSSRNNKRLLYTFWMCLRDYEFHTAHAVQGCWVLCMSLPSNHSTSPRSTVLPCWMCTRQCAVIAKTSNWISKLRTTATVYRTPKLINKKAISTEKKIFCYFLFLSLWFAITIKMRQ